MLQLLILTTFVGFLTVPAIWADPPKFEAVSVKPDHCSLQNSMDPGIIALRGDPLKVILSEAFKVKMDRIIGPAWLESDCFTINAKIPEGATTDQLPAMFQDLLVERFKLAVHKESQSRSGYALVLDKNGPKFKESDPNSPSIYRGQVTFGFGPETAQIKGAMTISTLARFVSNKLRVPVEDLTGLKGTYDIAVSWAPDRSLENPGPFAQDDPAGHSSTANEVATGSTAPKSDIFAAFRDSLGLRLKPRKEQIEVMVVDHIERVPTAN